MFFRCIFLSIALSYASTGLTQNLVQERNKLVNLNNQTHNLKQLNNELAQNIARLDQEIIAKRAESTEFSQALAEAESVLETSKAAYEESPNLINEGRVDNAQFKYAIAMRRYQKNNPGLIKLVEEQQELKKAFNANAITLKNNQNIIAAQTTLVTKLENEAEKVAEQQAIKQAEALAQKAEAKPAQDLKADEEELQTALAEVQRLREILAKQKQALIEEKKQQLATENRLAKNLQDANAQPLQQSLIIDLRTINEEAFWQQQADQGSEKAKDLFDKFLSIKTYENDNLRSRKTTKMVHLGNNIFLAKAVSLDAAKTSFVVAQQEWIERFDKTLDNQHIVLDLRNKDKPNLIIYPTNN